VSGCRVALSHPRSSLPLTGSSTTGRVARYRGGGEALLARRAVLGRAPRGTFPCSNDVLSEPPSSPLPTASSDESRRAAPPTGRLLRARTETGQISDPRSDK